MNMAFMRAGMLVLVVTGAWASTSRASSDANIRHSMPVVDAITLIYRSLDSTEPPFEGNVAVIEQSDGLIVVDAGGSPPSGDYVVAEIKKLSRKPVKYLIYTHYHGDHNLGAGAFRRAWPSVVIVSTDATRANMTGPPMDYIKTYAEGNQRIVDFAAQQLKRTDLEESVRGRWRHIVEIGPSMVAGYRNLVAYPADITFSDRLSIPDSKAPVEVYFLGRANTDGDAVVLAPRQGVVMTGDIVVNPIPYASASYPAEWITVIERLKAMQFAVLIPGHGPIQKDDVYLDTLVGALKEIEARVASLATNGATLDEVRKVLPFDDIKATFAGGDSWRRFAFDNFFLAAVVSNAYKEARRDPIVQGREGG
jgi:glyoxylase-like metal-dependent hydrolase (beta-lactamase superfamily II)